MPKARKLQIALEATAWYHVISRCVRSAFLCGQDQVTGRSFEHRRQWIENDLESLSSVFFIDIAAFAILSNQWLPYSSTGFPPPAMAVFSLTTLRTYLTYHFI